MVETTKNTLEKTTKRMVRKKMNKEETCRVENATDVANQQTN